MELNFTLDFINKASEQFLHKYSFLNRFGDVLLPCGKEHYFFLASLSSQFTNKKIIELGTHNGRSALALGFNELCTVYTYDIENLLINEMNHYKNVKFSLNNLFDPIVREKNKEHILSADLIFIDIDPHEGVMELEMFNWLKNNNYKGLILFDDIHLGQGHMGVNTGNSMQKTLWNNIEDKYKIDLTSVGHWSGTGLVSFDFNNNYKIIM